VIIFKRLIHGILNAVVSIAKVVFDATADRFQSRIITIIGKTALFEP
jgi:hypothetical protein